jgi:hypothetical protein
MRKIIATILFISATSNLSYAAEKLISLNKLDINNNKHYSTILARCSAIEVTELSLDDPNPNKKFNDMGRLIKENSKFIKFKIPGKSKADDARNAIRLHEYYVLEYQKTLNKNFISGDRSFCTKIKKKL